MRKVDIARRIHREAGISEAEAATLLDWILELLKTTLQQGESVSLSNFGVFRVWDKAARPGRNPRTGEAVMIAPRRAVTFHASPHLKTEVSAVQAEQQEPQGLLPKGK
jgi:integration host factor subunit alpha